MLVAAPHLITAVKEKNKLDICLPVHDSVPSLQVVLVTRETIDKKAELLFIGFHGLFHCLKNTDVFFFVKINIRIHPFLDKINDCKEACRIYKGIGFMIYAYYETSLSIYGYYEPLFELSSPDSEFVIK